jgi:hypothetical protein
MIFLYFLVLGTQAAPVTVAIHNYPPYYDSEGKGFVSDIYRAAFKEVGEEVKFFVYPTKRGVKSFFEGDVDAHSPGEMFFNSKQKSLSITEYVFKVRACWFYLRSNQKVKEDALKTPSKWGPYKLSVLRKSPYLELYQANKLNYLLAQDPEQLFRLLSKSRVDLAESTMLAGLTHLSAMEATDRRHYNFAVWSTINGGISFLNNNERSVKLHKKFKTGLKAIIENGKFKAILEKVWGKGNIPIETLLNYQHHMGAKQFSLDKFYSK